MDTVITQTKSNTKTIINDIAELSPPLIIDYLFKIVSQNNKTITKQFLNQIIHEIDDLYYNHGASPWNDQQYDTVFEFVKNELSEEKNILKIGANVAGTTVNLPYFMASMNKYKTIREIKNWSQKFKEPYIISAKLDGVSAMYHKNKLFTRGNGSRGRDISFLIPLLKQSLPLDTDLGFRGELIIRKSVFNQKYSDTFSNARNLVCGVLNRIYCAENEELYSDIEFIIYDVYHLNPLQFLNKLKIVNEHGGELVVHKTGITQAQLTNLKSVDYILNLWKTNYDFEIDGIIATNNKPCIHPPDTNPGFAFAYKNNVIGVEMKTGTVDKVLWNISKDNYFKPKIKLITPIVCNGSSVEFVTGFNAKYILQNNIKPGNVLRIGLSGNVIPHIFEIVDGCENKNWECLAHEINKNMLNDISDLDYVWSKNKVDLICTNKDNVESCIKKNMVFFNAFDMKCSLQETTLHNLNKSTGVHLLPDILSLNVKQWESVDKVGTKKGEKIVSAIKSTLDWNEIVQDESNLETIARNYFLNCLLGLQCFGRGFGRKKIEAHIDYLIHICFIDKNNISFHLLNNAQYVENKKEIIIDKVYSHKLPQITHDSVVLFCEGFIEFVNKYNEICKTVSNIELPTLEMLFTFINTKPVTNNIKDNVLQNVVFSGVRSKVKEQEYIAKGFQISDTVNKNTLILIVKDKMTNSAKIKRARDLGVQILSLSEI